MRNRKGFTLIELLAVIVILAILLAVAIPSITKYITNSRKDSLVTTAKDYADAVSKDATSELFEFPIATNDVTIVTLDKANLNKAKDKSSFGGKYIYNKSYVAIINIGTGSNQVYDYYFAAQDTKGYAIPLTNEKDLDSSKVMANAKNKMEVTIQSLCGSEEGLNNMYSNLSGLDNKLTGGEEWNATIFSTEECGKID